MHLLSAQLLSIGHFRVVGTVDPNMSLNIISYGSSHVSRTASYWKRASEEARVSGIDEPNEHARVGGSLGTALCCKRAQFAGTNFTDGGLLNRASHNLTICPRSVLTHW